MISTRMAAFALASIVWMAAPMSALGQTDDQRAANHFRAGTSYLSEGQNADALREFRAAYRLSGRPEMQYNIGLALERMGRWQEAREAYQHFVEERPDDPHAAEATARAEELGQREAEGTVQGGPAESGSAGTETGDVSTEGDGMSPIPWIVLGTSAAIGVAALITGLSAHGINNDLEEMCVGGVCPATLQDDADRGQTLATVSTVLTFTAIAGAAAGVALLFLLRGDSEEHAVAWGVAPTQDGVAGAVEWVF